MVPTLLTDLDKNTTARRTLCVINFDDSSIYISFVERFLLIIEVPDVFGKDDHKPVPFNAKYSYKNVEALLNDNYVYHSEQGEKRFPTSTLFHEIKRQRNFFS